MGGREGRDGGVRVRYLSLGGEGEGEREQVERVRESCLEGRQVELCGG